MLSLLTGAAKEPPWDRDLCSKDAPKMKARKTQREGEKKKKPKNMRNKGKVYFLANCKKKETKKMNLTTES